MAFPLREPEGEREIDRNLIIFGWLLILPSVYLLFAFNGYILASLLVGGISRLIVTAIRLPNGKRRYFGYLFTTLPVLTGVCTYFEFPLPWIFLAVFWSFLLYSEWRFFEHNRAEEAALETRSHPESIDFDYSDT